MRIGVVTTSYPAGERDFAGSFVAEHVAWLKGAGHEVEVIAAGEGGANGVHRVPAGSGLFDAGGAPEALEGRAAWLAAAAFSARLTAAVARRARRWDAIFAHWLAPSALAAVGATRLPVCAIAHSGDVHVLSRLNLLGAAAAAFDTPRVRLAFVSEGLRDRFLAQAGRRRERLAGRSLVTPMGVDTARLAAAKAERTGGRARVLFLGRLVPIKGVDLLLEAAARVPLPAEVVVAGDGPDRAELEQRARELRLSIEFRGAVGPAERDRLLASADVVCLPSREVLGGRSEGVPVVALEAMAAGAAVVCTDTGGLAELPRDAVTHVPAGDPFALATAICAILADPQRRRGQIEAAREHVKAFDWAEVGPALSRWAGC